MNGVDEISEKFAALSEASGVAEEQLRHIVRALAERRADLAGPITYTNRAARRARAKAERKN